jgi:hypothetical protein
METEILNILYNASDTKQQITNMYLSNDNFVFECTPLDITTNYDVSLNFLKYLESPGFTDVSAVATLDISASMINNLFIFQDNNTDEFVYGVNTTINNPLNFAFSNAKITKKYLNNEILDISLLDDYIESIVETITGTLTHYPERILKNVNSLRTFIVSLDTIFNNKLNSVFNTYYDVSLNDIPNTLNIDKTILNPMEIQCKNLITGVLNINKGPNSRLNTFLEDISGQTPPYSFVFNPGDKLAIRITYNPTYKIPKYRNYIAPRSYKIILNVIN